MFMEHIGQKTWGTLLENESSNVVGKSMDSMGKYEEISQKHL